MGLTRRINDAIDDECDTECARRRHGREERVAEERVKLLLAFQSGGSPSRSSMLVRLTTRASIEDGAGAHLFLLFVAAVARAVVQSTWERRRASKLYREHPPNGCRSGCSSGPVTMSGYDRQVRTSSYKALERDDWVSVSKTLASLGSRATRYAAAPGRLTRCWYPRSPLQAAPPARSNHVQPAPSKTLLPL